MPHGSLIQTAVLAAVQGFAQTFSWYSCWHWEDILAGIGRIFLLALGGYSW